MANCVTLTLMNAYLFHVNTMLRVIILLVHIHVIVQALVSMVTYVSLTGMNACLVHAIIMRCAIILLVHILVIVQILVFKENCVILT